MFTPRELALLNGLVRENAVPRIGRRLCERLMHGEATMLDLQLCLRYAVNETRLYAILLDEDGGDERAFAYYTDCAGLCSKLAGLLDGFLIPQ